VTVLLILNFRGESILGLEHETPQRATEVKNTLIFNAFVLCQVSLLSALNKLKEQTTKMIPVKFHLKHCCMIWLLRVPNYKA